MVSKVASQLGTISLVTTTLDRTSSPWLLTLTVKTAVSPSRMVCSSGSIVIYSPGLKTDTSVESSALRGTSGTEPVTMPVMVVVPRGRLPSVAGSVSITQV